MKIEKFSPKQLQILKFISSDKNYIICDGAVRSGKTVVMILSFILWAMEYFDKCNFAVCAKTVSNAERNILKPLQSIEGIPYTFEYKVTSKLLILRCRNRENYFYLFGGKDESSYMIIQGITLAGVFLDEVALMPRSFVEQALARTLTFSNAKIWFNCNPESPNHWFYKEWVLKSSEKNAVRLHFLMDDNPIMSKNEIDKAKTMFDGVFYDRYILGQWVSASGAIYKVFSDNPKKYTAFYPHYDFIQVGIDFGGNLSSHAFVACGIENSHNILTALMSRKFSATGLSPEDLYLLILDFLRDVSEKYGEVKFIYADCAEQTLINGLKSRTDIPVRNSIKNPILDRIRATTSLMSQNRFFMTDDCESLKSAFENAVYDQTKIDDVRLDNGSCDIDSLDAFEYSWERFLKKYVRS